jgi:iron complex outermembrane receptor protein
MNLHLDPSSLDANSAAAVGESPRHQFQVRSYLTLPQRLEFDSELYYVDSLPAVRIPSYERVDARLAWHAAESIELTVVGQNLLDDRYFEFGGVDITSPTQAKRSVYGEVSWRF